MTQSICRWGFLSTAGIGRKIWKAIRLSGNGRVTAVASRAKANARAFVDQCTAEVPMGGDVAVLGSYEQLIERDDVDVIYVPLPTGIRKHWVIAAANAGKHVLCEKPVAVNAADAEEMLTACNQNGVQFMDGVMFDHSARLRQLRGELGGHNAVGKLRRISTHFSFAGDEEFRRSDIRTDSGLEPHGCLGDLGWYCIRFTLWAAELAMPSWVSARTLASLRGKNSAADVPAEMSAEMEFANGVSAAFFCSFLTDNQQTALLSGDAGYISLDDFVLPFYGAELEWTEHRHVLEIDNCRWNFRRHSKRNCITEYAGGEPNAQEVNLVRTLSRQSLDGVVDQSFGELAIKTQRILDACRRSDADHGKPVAP